MSEAEKQRVTSEDVARASGVSRATVSYVLNNDARQSIPQETRERVLKAARELGYRPFTPARILRSGHSQLVLAVLPFEQVDPSLAVALKELEDRLADLGLTLIWHVGVHLRTGATHPSFNVTPSVILSYADAADPSISAFLQQFQVPIISALSDESTQRMVGATQVHHLVRHGKKQLLFAASAREDVRLLAQNRLYGVRQACLAHGLPEPSVCVVPSTRDAVRVLVREQLQSQWSSQGICCYNDEVAFALLAALADEGISVPQQVAVIGCDDIPLASFSIPALTSVHFERERSQDRLIEAIVAASRGEKVPEILQTELSITQRQSV
jgi:DNA-binding LacI/PurR family transcriptional regulator